MNRLLFALVLVPGLAFADGKDDRPADPPPPPPAPKVLDAPKPRPISIVDGTRDGAAGDRQCEPNQAGQIVCKASR